MARYQRNNDDDFDERGVLKDGRSFRVKLADADDLQRSVAAHFSRRATITDANGETGGLFRPGWRINPTLSRDTSFYDAYDRNLAVRYRDDHTSGITGAGETGARGPRIGDVCTVKASRDGRYGHEGDRGTYQRVEGENQLVCVSDRHNNPRSSDDGLDARAREYQIYDHDLTNAWRDPPRR